MRSASTQAIMFPVVEHFTSIQGEGVHTGVPMTFIRFQGCSVGKKICHGCDTAFEAVDRWRGGGMLSVAEIIDLCDEGPQWVSLTGGEPLDQPNLLELVVSLLENGSSVQVETSGTKPFSDLEDLAKLWISCSPKPGYLPDQVIHADEIKVIVPGLGSGEGWPGLQEALHWSLQTNIPVPVFLQPRNLRNEVSPEHLALCQELVLQNPSLRLSVQLHKVLRVR